MLRSVILAASRSSRIERLVATVPLARAAAGRFVAGTSIEDALRVTRQLRETGLTVSLAHLGEETTTSDQATAVRDEYQRLLAALAEQELAQSVEVDLRLAALGQRFDEQLAFDHAAAVCAAASAVGATVTLAMTDHTATDSALEILTKLRQDFPDTGMTISARLRRSEADCRDLAGPGSRVRLCQGIYAEPESVAYQSSLDVDKSYVRCLNILMSGAGYPILATHDPRLLAIGQDRGKWFGRSPDELEFQLQYGVRPAEQRRLADEGYPVRVYLPYGDRWAGYLLRQLADRSTGCSARPTVR